MKSFPIFTNTLNIKKKNSPGNPLADSEMTKRKSNHIKITRHSSADKQVNEVGKQQTKVHSGRISILASTLVKPAPASVKKARAQAFNSAKDTRQAKKTSIEPNQSNDTAPVPASKTNRRSSINPIPKSTIIVDGKMRYKCDECNYTNIKRYSVSMHMLDHKEKPFRCHICQRKFSEQDLLDIHLKVHQNKCSKCKRKFNNKEKWEQHEKNCKARRYECYLCHYVNKRKNSIIEHMRRHTGEKLLCKSCPKQFAYSSTLRDHEKCH